MDPLASAMERAKDFAKSGQDFVSSLFGLHKSPSRRNPIEILKRLQREAFSDLMKLRDRQDKVERIISLYKSSKGGPFVEASTRVRADIDVLGAIFLMGNIDEGNFDVLDKAGVEPGLLSRFTFETNLREKDSLVAELVTNHKGERHSRVVPGNQLSLAKVFYESEISDWFSAVAILVGARFRDIDAATPSSHQGMCLTEVSALGPPLLNQHNGSALGLTVRKSNITASLAQSISNHELEPGFDAIGHCFSTFGRVVCHIPRGVKLSLMGCHRVLKPSNNRHPFGAVAIPVGFLRRQSAPESTTEPSAPPLEMNNMSWVSSGSIALKLDSELDEFTRLGGWIEIQNSNPKHIKWAMSVSDNSEDEVGWGMSVGGIIDGPRNQDQFQVESYLKLNINNRFSLNPGLVYLTNGNGRTVGLMLRSHWSL
ncbi:PREDICTED: uncharacterized protein LOC104813224 [Tarenaya hassleriana]|uniref:uncharacterized protein LOC104813224 n=1 Tax=Tarenaya hassleriana TaxID=28532 RepID=UPI00053C2CC5|nr:PREDICTED: uncharacterized protein LOC104813224 [Tarenaya hassleriana]XP_010539094.1 PREDICTED: uncharacterized protein LOC104813224 [Tarenaya hassleriana]XP_010539095.1 PREDICTED: uncharacterized protein LOC104813224 [Tarenaya hassleriana]